MGYVLSRTYDNGMTVPIGKAIYLDREQVQAYAACLQAKSERDGQSWRYGVAGIVPLRDVPIRTGYSGPFHHLDDSCVPDTP